MANQSSSNRKPSKTVNRTRTLRRFRMDHKKKKFVDVFLRHPAMLLVLGFVLTAGMGGLFSTWQRSRTEEADKLRIEWSAADAALAKQIQTVADFENR